AGGGRRGRAPAPGPRPPLGALVLDDGSALELSTDFVVGREPAMDPSVAAGEAQPLGIVDAAVSRVHARIHLDGWQVLLTDLGSVNGTRIRPPGKRSEQPLEPNVPVPLQSGTRVLVGTQGFPYETHRRHQAQGAVAGGGDAPCRGVSGQLRPGDRGSRHPGRATDISSSTGGPDAYTGLSAISGGPDMRSSIADRRCIIDIAGPSRCH